MKICLVSEYYYPALGGITEHVHHFSRECIKKGHEVTLLTSNAGPIDPQLITPGLRIHHIGKSIPIISNHSLARVSLSPFFGTKVRKFYEQNPFDIVHVHALLMPTLPILAARYSNAPTVGTIHTYFEVSRYYQFFQKQCQAMLNQVDGIIAVSPSCIQAMQRYFTINPVIIPNGVDTKFFASGRRRPEFGKDFFTILFVGRLDPRNALEILINAFCRFRKERKNSRLIIAGDGPLLNYYRAMVPKEYVDDVKFVGPINQERPDYFASADLFCYPATKASFGITLLEAMAAGVPVVASKIHGFSELVRDRIDGLLVPENDAVSLAEAFKQLADSPDLRIRMGEHGRMRAEEYSWNVVTDKILDYYHRLLQPERNQVYA